MAARGASASEVSDVDYDDDFEQYEDDFEFEDDASENEFESGKDDGVLLEGGPSVSTQGISSDNRDNLPEGDRHISSATNEVSTTVATPHPPLDSNVPSNDLLHADGSPRYHVTKSESILHEAEARIKPSVTPKQVWSVHAQQGVQAESELEPTERALARRLEDSSADPSPLVSVHTAAGAPSKNPIHQHTPPVSDSAPETLQLEAPTPEEADDERAASTNLPLPASSPPVPEGVESADPSPSLHVLLERAPATPPESEPLYTPFSTEGSRSDVWGGTESGASTRRDDSGEDDEGPVANQQEVDGESVRPGSRRNARLEAESDADSDEHATAVVVADSAISPAPSPGATADHQPDAPTDSENEDPRSQVADERSGQPWALTGVDMPLTDGMGERGSSRTRSRPTSRALSERTPQAARPGAAPVSWRLRLDMAIAMYALARPRCWPAFEPAAILEEMAEPRRRRWQERINSTVHQDELVHDKQSPPAAPKPPPAPAPPPPPTRTAMLPPSVEFYMADIASAFLCPQKLRARPRGGQLGSYAIKPSPEAVEMHRLVFATPAAPPPPPPPSALPPPKQAGKRKPKKRPGGLHLPDSGAVQDSEDGMSILDVAVAAKIATGGTTVTKRKKRPPRPVAVAAPELELELGDPAPPPPPPPTLLEMELTADPNANINNSDAEATPPPPPPPLPMEEATPGRGVADTASTSGAKGADASVALTGEVSEGSAAKPISRKGKRPAARTRGLSERVGGADKAIRQVHPTHPAADAASTPASPSLSLDAAAPSPSSCTAASAHEPCPSRSSQCTTHGDSHAHKELPALKISPLQILRRASLGGIPHARSCRRQLGSAGQAEVQSERSLYSELVWTRPMSAGTVTADGTLAPLQHGKLWADAGATPAAASGPAREAADASPRVRAAREGVGMVVAQETRSRRREHNKAERGGSERGHSAPEAEVAEQMRAAQEARASAVDKAKAGLSEMERLQDDLDAARREKTKCLAALQLAEERARAGRSQLDADVARLTSDADGAAQRLSELLPRTVQAEAEWQLAKQALEQEQDAVQSAQQALEAAAAKLERVGHTTQRIAASSAPDDPDDARDDSCDGIETSQLTSQSADRDTDNRIRLAKQRQAASRVATQAELALLQANQRASVAEQHLAVARSKAKDAQQAVRTARLKANALLDARRRAEKAGAARVLAGREAASAARALARVASDKVDSLEALAEEAVYRQHHLHLQAQQSAHSVEALQRMAEALEMQQSQATQERKEMLARTARHRLAAAADELEQQQQLAQQEADHAEFRMREYHVRMEAAAAEEALMQQRLRRIDKDGAAQREQVQESLVEPAERALLVAQEEMVQARKDEAEAVQVQKLAKQTIVESTAALIELRTREAAQTGNHQMAADKSRSIKSQIEALTAQHSSLLQSASEVRKLMAELPPSSGDGHEAAEAVSHQALESVRFQLRSLSAQLEDCKLMLEAAQDMELDLEMVLKETVQHRQKVEKLESDARLSLSGACERIASAKALYQANSDSLGAKQLAVTQALAAMTETNHGIIAKQDAARLGLLAAQGRVRTERGRVEAMQAHQGECLQAREAARLRARLARFVFSNEMTFQKHHSSTTAVPQAVLLRIRLYISETTKSPEELLKPSNIADLAITFNYSIQHVLDAVILAMHEKIKELPEEARKEWQHHLTLANMVTEKERTSGSLVGGDGRIIDALHNSSSTHGVDINHISQ